MTETLNVTYNHDPEPEHSVYGPDPNQDDPVHLLLRPYEYAEDQQLLRPFPARRDQPALIQLAKHERFGRGHYRHLRKQVVDLFANMRFLELSPERMREPAFPGTAVLGDGGENLPAVLRDICADPEREKILASWVAELTPMDVTGFEFPTDPSGRVHLTLCEANGRKVSAYSASDGTLRFLAVLAALLADGPEMLYFIEELDTGIHPVRLGLLLDMLEGPVRGNAQVIGTTHAPTLLKTMSDETFENTSVVCRLEDTADAIIRSVAQLPNARQLRQEQGMGRLHESGWMEDALFFTEGYDEAEHDS